MTIAAAYLTSNGVVLGADSTTTITVTLPDGKTKAAQLFHHAQKVFCIGENGRMGACVFGGGRIGNVSHRTLLARLGDWLTDDKTVEDAARQLGASAQAAAGAGGLAGVVGYFIGGRDNDRTPRCYEVGLTPGQPPAVKPFAVGSGQFAGQPTIFDRVFRGYDPELPTKLLTELRTEIGNALPSEAITESFNKAFDKIKPDLAIAGFPDLPIREAIDFVHAYLHVTVKAYKFKYGPLACGGPIEIAFITTDRQFRWAAHKSFDIAMSEQSSVQWSLHHGHG